MILENLKDKNTAIPQGDIWARAVDNLSKVGAKVTAFDIQFDSPDARSSTRSVKSNLPRFQQYLPVMEIYFS